MRAEQYIREASDLDPDDPFSGGLAAVGAWTHTSQGHGHNDQPYTGGDADATAYRQKELDSYR